MLFQMNDKIVFIGDSITDKGRKNDPLKLGGGYVRLLHDYFTTTRPELGLTIINEGTSGNRIVDLQRRWRLDVIEHKAQWVSVSIGINDVWRQFDSSEAEQVYPDRFAEVYKNLLKHTKNEINCRFILMEPTIIKEYPDSIGNRMLQPYVDVVRGLADEFHAVLVPTHDAFIRFLRRETGKALTTDGVHMTSLGDMLMATTWLKAVEDFNKRGHNVDQ